MKRKKDTSNKIAKQQRILLTEQDLTISSVDCQPEMVKAAVEFPPQVTVEEMPIKTEPAEEEGESILPDKPYTELIKLEELDESKSFESSEIILSSKEDVLDFQEVKTEIKLDLDAVCDGMENMKEEISNHMTNSSNSDANQGKNVSSGSNSGFLPQDTVGEEEAVDSDSELTGGDDITCRLQGMLKAYCEAHAKNQNMLFALGYSLPSKHICILKDIITSSQELATSLRLMANSVKSLADAERVKSKAAIIKTRIELAKAKRDGISIT